MKTIKLLAVVFLATISTVSFSQNGNGNGNNGNGNGGNFWKPTGNNGNTSDFIGTTNNQELILKSNNIEGLRITPNAETQLKGDLVMDKFKIITGPPKEQFLKADNNGKITSMDKSGLLESLYKSGASCIPSTGVGQGTPVWVSLDQTPFSVMYTGVDCPSRVGLGTNAPEAMLDVRGDVYFPFLTGIGDLPNQDYRLNVKRQANQQVGIHLNNDISPNFPITTKLYGIKNTVVHSGVIAYSVTNPSFGKASADLFKVMGNGNVGIGFLTDITNNKVHIKSGSLTGLLVETNHVLDNEYAIQSRVNRDLTKAFAVFNSQSSEENFIVYGNGNVYATKITVQQTPFPDYVFKTDYELMSLQELDSYIKLNGHLPNMPTAKEVEENGADLGEINRVLVEKVEELTLYLLEQEKRIQQLEKGQ
jgi:hypothetical protein